MTILQFPKNDLTAIREVEGIVWPNKTEVIRRRLQFTIDEANRFIDIIANDPEYSREEKQGWNSYVEGLEYAMLIVEQESK